MKITEKNHIAVNDKLLNELMLTDLIDKDELQKLQDTFAKANRIAATIVDVNGNPITEPSNHSNVCTLIRQTQKGFENCIMSGKNLGVNAIKLKRAYFHKCQSIGFVDACAPIIIEGVHLASWLIGQNWIGDVDENRIISYAEEIGTDKQEMLEAFQKMDKMSETEFRDKLDFLWTMANQISLIAFHNLRHKSMVKSLQKTKKELEKYQNNLEIIIEKRTAEIKTLSGLLPICMHCKKIRDDGGYWNEIESYISQRSSSTFSHGICPVCAKHHYPDIDIYDD